MVKPTDKPIYYRFPQYQPPETVGLHPFLPRQQAHIDQILKRAGVDEVRVGMEYEFGFKPNKDTTMIEAEQMVPAIRDLAQRVYTHIQEMPDQQEAARRLQEAKTFSVAELIMYDLHEMDPRTKGKLEPLFGKGRGDHSYYDSVGCLEIKSKPMSPNEHTQFKHVLLDAIQEKAATYGLKLQNPPELHMNVSFWKDGKNLLDPAHPGFKTTGAKIVNGIMLAANHTHQFGHNLDRASLGPSREDDFRIIGEGNRARLECRIQSMYEGGMAWRDPETLLEYVVKPGAAYGLEHGDIAGMDFPKRGAFTRTGENFKLLLHTLQGSTLTERGDGSYGIVSPKGYVWEKAEDIAQELGLTFAQGSNRQSYIQAVQELTQLQANRKLNPEELKRLEGCREYLKKPRVDEHMMEAFVNGITLTKGAGHWNLHVPAAIQGYDGIAIPVPVAAITGEIACEAVVDSMRHESYPRQEYSFHMLRNSPVYAAANNYLEKDGRTWLESRLVTNRYGDVNLTSGKEHKKYASTKKNLPALPKPPMAETLTHFENAVRSGDMDRYICDLSRSECANREVLVRQMEKWTTYLQRIGAVAQDGKVTNMEVALDAVKRSHIAIQPKSTHAGIT